MSAYAECCRCMTDADLRRAWRDAHALWESIDHELRSRERDALDIVAQAIVAEHKPAPQSVVAQYVVAQTVKNTGAWVDTVA